MKRAESIPPEGRDQDPTPFSAILQDLLWLEPRATAAVLIDREGETVDYASSLSSYFTKVSAANLRVVLDDIALACSVLERKIQPAEPTAPSKANQGKFGADLMQAMIRASERTFFVRPLADDYALVLMLRRHAFTVSSRAVTLTVCRLAKEAGWPAPAEETLPWHPAEVESRRGDRFRPTQMKAGDAWERVEVLGSIVGLTREKGYRCRLQGGAEITLVRESTGVWFVDQPTRGLSSHQPARGQSHHPFVEPTAATSTSRRPEARVSAHPKEPTADPSKPPSAPQSGSSEPTQNRVVTPGERGDMWVKETKRAR